MYRDQFCNQYTTIQRCQKRLRIERAIYKHQRNHPRYTGNQEDFSKSKRKLSEGAVIGISVSVTLAGFLMLVYGSYFLYKRNTGYSVRWIHFQEEEESDLAHTT